ncbi:MAG: 3-deoxy-D-manno-octulosonic acid transferase [Bacteroidetes bacterium]|nr:MAG: 3-deoxy-D-manno-octulosonic acid transferase [Bacteroidota bacterium]
MRALYNILTHVAYAHLQLAKGFSKKLKLFVDGRNESFGILSSAIEPTDETIWFHCASLGEFEQGMPIISAIKDTFPDHKIVLTFFSPSGYEIKKQTPLADVVAYLPFDTKRNAKKFISAVHPSMAIFVKYEIWPNYLFELQEQKVPALLVSGSFRKNQIFFKAHGGFMRKALRTIDHFFVQNAPSEALLKSLKLENITLSGDTRFDRVSHQIEMDNSLDFMDAFKGDSLCVVCGSTWPEDEELLLDYINSSEATLKFVIAPHKIDATKIEYLRRRLTKKSVLFSEREHRDLSEFSIFIIDTIGYLTKIYSYADVAYVGGAAGTSGLHNILEPATFGIPIVIGNNFNKFPEAKKLEQLAGLYSVSDAQDCSSVMEKLISDNNFRSKTGMIAGHFVNSNTGATRIIMEYIKQLHRHRLIQIPSEGQ